MTITVGCIEDHDPDAHLLKHALEVGRIAIDHFYRATDLAGLAQMLDVHTVDLILLDLGLPDSAGVDTVVHARELAGNLPIIVLTGSEQNGVEAIASGADDFLSKDLIGAGQLARIVTYAVERHRLRIRLEEMEHERDIDRIAQGTVLGSSTVSARMLGDVPLRELAPDVHNDSVATFTEVVRDRLRRNAMGASVADDHRMRLLGERLAGRNAGPDDVVRLLADSVDRQRQQLGPAQFGPFVREARLALIELMGFVLANYRRHALVGRARAEANPTSTLDIAAAGATTDLGSQAISPHQATLGELDATPSIQLGEPTDSLAHSTTSPATTEQGAASTPAALGDDE